MRSPFSLLDLRPLPVVQILDIGARSEGDDSYQAVVDLGLAEVTGFEPDPASFAALQSRSGPYRYFQNFLGDGQEASFQVCAWPGCSSLLEPDPAIINLFCGIGAEAGANFSVISRHRVATTRLDDLPGIAPDLIKIDVQGAERLVLSHGSRALESALIVQCEVEFLPLYKDQPLFGEMQTFFQQRGFHLHKLIDVHGRTFRPLQLPDRRAALSQMLWADALFVRDISRLDRWSDDDLLKGALLLHDLYLSYDLVLVLLTAHDRRQALAGAPGGLAEAYAARLRRSTNLTRLYLNEGR